MQFGNPGLYLIFSSQNFVSEGNGSGYLQESRQKFCSQMQLASSTYYLAESYVESANFFVGREIYTFRVQEYVDMQIFLHKNHMGPHAAKYDGNHTAKASFQLKKRKGSLF